MKTLFAIVLFVVFTLSVAAFLLLGGQNDEDIFLRPALETTGQQTAETGEDSVQVRENAAQLKLENREVSAGQAGYAGYQSAERNSSEGNESASNRVAGSVTPDKEQRMNERKALQESTLEKYRAITRNR